MPRDYGYGSRWQGIGTTYMFQIKSQFPALRVKTVYHDGVAFTIVLYGQQYPTHIRIEAPAIVNDELIARIALEAP